MGTRGIVSNSVKTKKWIMVDTMVAVIMVRPFMVMVFPLV